MGQELIQNTPPPPPNLKYVINKRSWGSSFQNDWLAVNFQTNPIDICSSYLPILCPTLISTI